MRMPDNGRIDRDRPISFTFDKRRFSGFAGDTLASALLANGIRLMGRSFKYHRPRGVFSDFSAEPSALVTTGRRGGQIPNVRATMQELYEGLAARSQNRWPTLENDLMGVNDRLARFMPAGFYYKTFMWPRSFWEKLYEPAIRRAAGLGALSGKPAEDAAEKAFAHCDLLVIGAGPAGLMAALTAAKAGADVILADERPELGGALGGEAEDIAGKPALDWVAATEAALRAMPNLRIMTRTTVTGAYDTGTYAALERVSAHLAEPGDLPTECFWRIAAKQAVLAAGALERAIAFPDNDRPGVMLASAARSFLHRFGVVAGQRVAIFCNNDDGHRTARDMVNAGVPVSALIDSRADATCDLPVAFHPGGRVTATEGRIGLAGITVTSGGKSHAIPADCLAVAGGWNPSLHLTCHHGARPDWDDSLAAFVPKPGAVPGLTAAGAASGAFSTAACLASGRDAAKAAIKALGLKQPRVSLPAASDATAIPEALWRVPGKGRAWLDLQNDVTVKDVELAARENYRSVEHMKRYTTQGMSPDQGKSSNVLALAVLADVTGRTIPETGTTTFRPPFSPVAIAAMGAGGSGDGFAPQRLMTSHQATVALGAPMVEAGLWYRPAYFPRPGAATWREACDREVLMVRDSVGVADVSTLGKIDVQGPDAARFLDFLYTNRMSSLKPGRVRYGVMLREDGHIMDDGTVTCLGPEHYLLTTTTAAAGQVMVHMDFVHQGLRPGWDLRFVSVTEQWAQFAVAGPQARAVLNSLLTQPLDNAVIPYMGWCPVTVEGVSGRLFRISFSGEHGYEIAVPARFGDALFRLLLAQAGAHGGGPYGMEALNVMRLEKGFPTHAELHGRITMADMGLQRMIAPDKDCIGKTMAARPGLVADDRARMVGLRARAGQITAGGHLFAEGSDTSPANDLGYVTSAGFSPVLGASIGQGFVKGGRGRIGDTLSLRDGLRGSTVAVEVCDPVFLDPAGGRVRG